MTSLTRQPAIVRVSVTDHPMFCPFHQRWIQ